MGNYQTRQIIPSRQQSLFMTSKLSNTSSIFLNSNINSLDDYFLLDNVDNIHLTVMYKEIFFIWLQPRVEQNQHLQNRTQLKFNLPNFTYHQSFDQLQQRLNKENGNTIFRVIVSGALEKQEYQFINRNRYVDKIYVFAQNQSRIKDIMFKYIKAKYYGFTIKQIMQQLPVPSTYQNNLLFFVQEDLSLIKKYCLNYYSYIHHKDVNQSRKDFNELALKLYPNKSEEIHHFDQTYMQVDNEGKRNLIMSEIFQNSFYWDLVIKLPKFTSNPKRLGYLRFPFKDMFQMILHNYRTSQNRNIDTIYIVTELSDQQISYLQESYSDKFMMFNTFVKGFITRKNANNCYRKMRTQGKKPYFFEVDLPYKKALKQQLNFGYMIMDKRFEETESSPSVLFNLFNVFRVNFLDRQKKQAFMTYGALSELYILQQQINSRRFLKQSEVEILGLLDQFESRISKIKNQVSVYKQSGCYIESIISCQTALTELQRGKKPREQLQLVLLEKGDSLKLNGNLNDAIQTYLLIQNEELKTLARIRATGIQIQRGNIQQAQLYFQFVLPRIEKLLKTWGLLEQHYLARYYHFVLQMRRQEYKQAYQGFKQLKDEIFSMYDFKIDAVEFMDDLLRYMNVCCRVMIAQIWEV